MSKKKKHKKGDKNHASTIQTLILITTTLNLIEKLVELIHSILIKALGE